MLEKKHINLLAEDDNGENVAFYAIKNETCGESLIFELLARER